MTGDLIKKGNVETDMNTGRMPSKHEGRDQSDASTSHRTPKIGGIPPASVGVVGVNSPS